MATAVLEAKQEQTIRPSVCDRRITRTRQALRDALIALIDERGYDTLSVGDVCVAANVTRGTFYNHFTSKEDMLASFEDEVMEGMDAFKDRMAQLSLKELVYTVTTKRPLPLLVELFDYLRSEGAFLHAVLGPHGDSRFSSRLRDEVCVNIVRSVLHKRYRDSGDAFVQYYMAFYANAYLGVIERWLATGMEESSQDMALIAQRLLFITPGESIKL